ncbi:hypothetical protein SSX86_023061 [Deinandra increscens subsp. villosa]|uniref:RNA-directed DNA polymerase, eukaryota n=1 Tax=Deinandra increscens subsp. villosa TaxID=3103831 RepID=A0AAP0CLM4_9ASTR
MSGRHRPSTSGSRPDKSTRPSFHDTNVDQWFFPSKAKRPIQRNSSPTPEQKKPPIHQNYKDLQKVSSSVFITNFPPDSSPNEIRKHCEVWGKISDVYISQRLSKSGRKFGFVRFIGVKDIKELIERLRTIWIGSYHLYADQVKSPSNPSSSQPSDRNSGKRVVETVKNPVPSHAPVDAKVASSMAKTFADLLKPIMTQQVSSTKVPLRKSIAINMDECLDAKTSNFLMGKVTDPLCIPNLPALFVKEGFHEVRFRYIGGRWVGMSFPDVDLITKFEKSVELNNCFSSLQLLSKDFIPDERCIWLDIIGLPVVASTPMVLKKVGELWGEFLFFGNDRDEPLANGKICINTSSMVPIDECIDVELGGAKFAVRVKEFANWTPSLRFYEDSSSSDGSENEEDIEDGELNDVDINFEAFQEESKKIEEVPKKFHEMEIKEAPMLDNLSSTCNMKSNKVDGGEAKEASVEASVQSDPSKPPGFEEFVSSKKGVKGGSDNFSHDEWNYGGSMNILSLNVCGSGSTLKQSKISNILKKFRVNFVGLQETRMTNLDLNRVKSIWGNFQFDVAFYPSVGLSGGMLSIWDPSVFVKDTIFSLDHLLIVKGTWSNFSLSCYMINVYAPQLESQKISLWHSIMDFMNYNIGTYIIFGDFNSIRSDSEKIGVSSSRTNMFNFNGFIHDGGLIDIPMGGYHFTRVDAKGRNASKLDRFLVSPNLFETIQNVEVLALDKTIVDHRPILLRQSYRDFGPIPFKFFNSWMSSIEFDNLVKVSWADPYKHPSKLIQFKEKLKRLKERIKVWRKSFSDHNSCIADIQSEILSIDRQFDYGNGNDHMSDRRLELLKDLADKEKPLMEDLAQKAKIKWGKFGDENSKFYHGIINCKRRQMALSGLKIDGVWVDNPSAIKNAFVSFFANKFKKGNENKVTRRSDRFRSISLLTRLAIELPPSLLEVKEAVWACGSDKAPGPDGFSLGFVKKYWDLLKDDILGFVREFFDTAHLPLGCNASFISLIPKVQSPASFTDYRPISLVGLQYKVISKILANRMSGIMDQIISPEQSAFIKGRQILDGPLMLNEIVDWYRFKKKPLLLFKIDFAKAYDTVSWDYLDTMLHFMGFGDKWRSWVRACLSSTRASILINGSPSAEFNIGRGLRQGDPMAPFLFILVMEGLHVFIEDSVAAGLYKGIQIKNLNLSHLFYADDAIFIGQWSLENVSNIIEMLKIFHQVSGLSINFQKSSIFGIGVNTKELARFAKIVGCKSDCLPFSYLGLPVGKNMSRIANWIPILEKFNKRLNKWKRNLLSIGGRATLVTSVLGALGSYYFSMFPLPRNVIKKLESIRARFFWGFDDQEKKSPWIKWDLVLTSKENGGLGFGSLFAMNIALLYKWRWRFVNEGDALWTRLIKVIHGDCIDKVRGANFPSTWRRIYKACKSCNEMQLLPSFVIRKQVGLGNETRFWKDIWIDDVPLLSRFPRLFALSLNKDGFISNYRDDDQWIWFWRRNIRGGVESEQFVNLLERLSSYNFSNIDDKWSWCLDGDSEFSVKRVRKYIDNQYLPKGNLPTKWLKYVPKKVNITVWRILLDRLPTRLNLSKRGLELESIMCPICYSKAESITHLLGDCSFFTKIMARVKTWLDSNWLDTNTPLAMIKSIDDSKCSRMKKDVIYSIIYTTWWHVWKSRNLLIFKPSEFRNGSVFDSIVLLSFSWGVHLFVMFQFRILQQRNHGSKPSAPSQPAAYRSTGETTPGLPRPLESCNMQVHVLLSLINNK